MKLSEAIRLGSMMKPQGFDGWFGDSACALSGAAEFSGVKPMVCPHFYRLGIDYVAMRERFPTLTARLKHPVHGRLGAVDDIIINLNDQHRWTRELIADWVETIENAQEAANVEPEMVAAK